MMSGEGDELGRDGAQPTPWAEIVGRCHTVESFAVATQMTAAEVTRAAEELRILCLETADGQALLPAFQLRDGKMTPLLGPVLKALQSGIDDPWTWAQWLTTSTDDGVAPIEDLWAGRFLRTLVAARQDARAWWL